MINLPDTVFIAFGVVSAAIIAGVFSYINLVSVKESKVSEFRQNWIKRKRGRIYLQHGMTVLENKSAPLGSPLVLLGYTSVQACQSLLQESLDAICETSQRYRS